MKNLAVVHSPITHRPHNALFTNDIIRLVFTLADPHEGRNYALVCKAWLEPAMDHHWAVVDDAARIFALLGQLHMDPPEPDDSRINSPSSGCSRLVGAPKTCR